MGAIMEAVMEAIMEAVMEAIMGAMGVPSMVNRCVLGVRGEFVLIDSLRTNRDVTM